MIVGAGPSLDEGLETLQRIRDRVVLFSCGTALRPLLRNGIVPDFHCELENVPEVHGVIARGRGNTAISSQITLIASATVDPRVPPLFGETIFFFRDSVSSTEILGGALPRSCPARRRPASMSAWRRRRLWASPSSRCSAPIAACAPAASVHAEGTIYRDIGMWQDKRARKAAIRSRSRAISAAWSAPIGSMTPAA